MSTVATLRAATAPAHDRVDAVYGGYDLADRESYTRFLLAHARALPAVERALAEVGDLPPWRTRSEALAADLAELGAAMPAPRALTFRDDAATALGMLYVIEGSRLGGVMLSRGVGQGLPNRYLAARHLPGEWRALLAAIDAARLDDAAVTRAIDGAEATFRLYEKAVEERP